MTDLRNKTPRTVLLADHLWDAYGALALEMGSEREALINQALYVFARLHGASLPAAPAQAEAQPPEDRAAPPAAHPATGLRRFAGPEQPHAEPVSSLPWPDSLPDGASTELDPVTVRIAREPSEPPLEESAPPPEIPPVLVLLADGGRELDRVAKDRFLIGRGKHCDLIINSGKVSREHAAITREGHDWFIEDLGSSNGTWHEKRRITRRRIHDGDEYFICSEKLGCAFRG